MSELIDAQSGAISAHYEYSAFGETIVATGPLAFVNPFRFSTKFTDDEIAMLYYGYRYYSPSLGRWPSRDPIGEDGGVNLIRAFNNNAINQVDSYGNSIFGPKWKNKKTISEDLLSKAICVLRKMGFSDNWALHGSIATKPTIYVAESSEEIGGEVDWLRGASIIINQSVASENRIQSLAATLLHEFTHYHWIFTFDITTIPGRYEDAVYKAFNTLSLTEVKEVCCSINGKARKRNVNAWTQILCDCNVQGCVKCE